MGVGSPENASSKTDPALSLRQRVYNRRNLLIEELGRINKAIETLDGTPGLWEAAEIVGQTRIW